MLLTGVSRA